MDLTYLALTQWQREIRFMKFNWTPDQNQKSILFRTASILILLIVLKVQASEKKPVSSIKQVRTVYVLRLSGDRVFASRLKNEMRKMGLKFVSHKANADAVLTGSGQYKTGAFSGQIKFYNRNGKLIWKAKAFRPRNSNDMAYSRLSGQLRRALKK